MLNKIILLFLSFLPGVAMSSDYVKFSTGSFSSVGQSSTANSTESSLYSIPLLASWRKGRWYASVSSAYISSTTTYRSSNTTQVDNGFGDTSFSLAYDLTESPWITVKIKEKVATGSSASGLSTGKNDTSLQLDYFTAFSQKASAFATLGYKVVGKVSGQSMQNTFYGSVGYGYLPSSGLSVGASLDYRESIYTTLKNQLGVSVFLDKKLFRKTNVSLFAAYDDTSTYSGGLTLSYKF